MANSMVLKKLFVFSILVMCMISCHIQPSSKKEKNKILFKEASLNAHAAREGYRRSNDYMNAWLAYADPRSKLVPRRITDGSDGDVWNAEDCAADNYPFLVLTSFFTDQEKYTGLMLEMLENEKRLTSRVESLPDTYSFSKGGFYHEEVSMNRIVFGASEYMKDGLMPLTEWLGLSPWSERMITMLDDLDQYVNVAGAMEDGYFGNEPHAEVNGELLQVLSRMYWMTAKQKYLVWAIQIADFFLLDNGYPLTHLENLRLRDHGCELVAGLCELYTTLHFVNKTKKEEYRDSLYRLLNCILQYGRNDDGFFYNAINPQTGEINNEGLSDSWGYMLNGYYSVFMIDGIINYNNAVNKIFENLHKYRNYNWENHGADGFADAIEGAINLYNRLPNKQAAQWIDSEIKEMWSLQDSNRWDNAQEWKGSGIIEGWYGDGNFARTTLMYNLWKSQGTYISPWIEKMALGAVARGDTLYISMNSEADWEGKLYFDKARHSKIFNMPMDWPRINQFPEWFVAEPKRNYKVTNKKGKILNEFKGEELHKGITIRLTANVPKYLVVF